MYRCQALILSLCVISLTYSAAPPAADVKATKHIHIKDGYYLADGVYPDGSTYETVAYLKRERFVYVVKWFTGESPTIGIGFRDPDSDNLVVGWANTKTAEGQMRGVVSYRVTAEGLIGRWTSIPGDGSFHSEKLTFLRALPKPRKPVHEDARHVPDLRGF